MQLFGKCKKSANSNAGFVGRPLLPSNFITLRELGLALTGRVLFGYEKKVLEAKDIVGLANINPS